MKNYNAKFFCLFTTLLNFLIHFELTAQTIINEPYVRVRIIHNADSLRISFNSIWKLSGYENSFSAADSILAIKVKNRQLAVLKNNKVILLSPDHFELESNAGTLNIMDVPYGVGWWWEGKEQRVYEGDITIYNNSEGKIDVVIQLALEQYLKGVIPYEIGGDSPLEALKTQAVAARSEAIVALQSELYSGLHHDLTSDVECQVFSGNHKRNAMSDKAVEMTDGLILSENDKPINAYYASNCGGHSEMIENVWPERPAAKPYLAALADREKRTTFDLDKEENIKKWILSNPDVYCNPDKYPELPSWSRKNFRWEKTQDFESISKELSRGKDLGLLHEIKALNRGPSGRIYKARFIFEKDSFDIKGELNIRQLWQPALRSSCFIVNKTDSTFILSGAGWGHGVGMCQSGAVVQAQQGKSFEEILKHYYPGATLQSLYKPH